MRHPAWAALLRATPTAAQTVSTPEMLHFDPNSTRPE